MRKVEFRNRRGIKLAADVRSERPSPWVVMVHGFGSDRYAGGRFVRLAEALEGQGFSTLAFDLSGCGESESDIWTLAKFREDLRAAVDFAVAEGAIAIGLVGHSLGAITCLQLFPAPIAAMVLTGAVTGGYNFQLTPGDLAEIKQKGSFTITLPGPQGTEVDKTADVQLVRECAALDTKELFSNVTCPTLLIFGSEDNNRFMAEGIESIPEVKVKPGTIIIPRGDHNLYGVYDQVIGASLSWFDLHMRAKFPLHPDPALQNLDSWKKPLKTDDKMGTY